jgi:hypothetical protein
MQAGVPEGSVLFLTLGVNLTLFADDTCLYETERTEVYVLRKVQRGLNSMSAWCERWYIKTNEDKSGDLLFLPKETA